MLDPSECFTAPISAAKTLTLVQPRTRFEHQCLTVMSEGSPFAVCLDDRMGLGPFRAFQCDTNVAWKGLHIPEVRIELDETSLRDADRFGAPRGSMVRRDDKLAILVNLEDQFHASEATLTILEGLPMCAPQESAHFVKWQVVLGEGQEKRVLLKVDVTPKTQSI